MCGECGQRPATLFQSNGKTKRSPGHDMCRKCWRAVGDRIGSRHAAERLERMGLLQTGTSEGENLVEAVVLD